MEVDERPDGTLVELGLAKTEPPRVSTSTNLDLHAWTVHPIATLKGRLWSNQVADDILEWTEWCRALGTKLLDDSVTIDEINKWFVIPEELTARPALVPLDIDWSDELYVNQWGRSEIRIGDDSEDFYDVPIELVSHDKSGPIQFTVKIGAQISTYEVKFGESGPSFVHVADDHSYEVGDVVCLKQDGTDLVIHLIHCKYSGEPNAGYRVDDLYEVCGQAQKSIKWRERVQQMLHRLAEQETKAQKAGHSRFQKGGMQQLVAFRNGAHLLRPRMTISIVQPGLSKKQASQDQLELLGGTASYLMETYQIPLGVISSD